MTTIDMRIQNAELFGDRLNKFLKDNNDKFSQILRKVVLTVLTGIVKYNPVDTGLSQNNWQVDFGRVNDDILDADTNENAPIKRAERVLERMPNGGIGQIVFIYNNVFYTVYLEFGTEKMPAFAMVRTALGEVAVQL